MSVSRRLYAPQEAMQYGRPLDLIIAAVIAACVVGRVLWFVFAS